MVSKICVTLFLVLKKRYGDNTVQPTLTIRRLDIDKLIIAATFNRDRLRVIRSFCFITVK